jgi:hypothetical protein
MHGLCQAREGVSRHAVLVLAVGFVDVEGWVAVNGWACATCHCAIRSPLSQPDIVVAGDFTQKIAVGVGCVPVCPSIQDGVATQSSLRSAGKQ